MAIRYNIPEVSPQKGPTCWYYTAKMLMKFHNLIGPGQQLDKEWKLLHLVRKAITELSQEKRGTGKDDIVKKLTEMMQKEVDGLKRADLRDARSKIQTAASTERFNILDAFFDGSLVQRVELGGRAYDARFVEDSLRAYGPMYSSIYRLGAGFFDDELVKDPMQPAKYVYKLDEKCAVGGKHAIVIAGVDDNQNIYYKDPHTPHRFTMVQWDVFKLQLNSPGGSIGDSLFGAIQCKGCTHLSQKL